MTPKPHGQKSIAIIISSLKGGGAEKVCLTLTKALQEQGAKVQLIVLSRHCDYDLDPDIEVVFLTDNSPKLRLKKTQVHLAQKLRALNEDTGPFDLVLSNLDECHPIVSLAELPNSYYVIHNSIEEELKRAKKMGPIKYWRKVKQFRALNNKSLISVSRGIENEIRQKGRICATSIQTIYNPIDIEEIRSLAEEENPNIPSEPYIIHIGRYAKQKRHDLLLSTFELMGPQYILVLLTDKPEALQRLVNRRKLEKRAKIVGFQQNPYPWIKLAKALVLTSDFEGFGMVLAEALACGTPIVSTNCPHGPNEILTGSLTKYLTPTKDAKNLSNCLNLALQNKTDFSDAKILPNITVEIISKKYLGLIRLAN